MGYNILKANPEGDFYLGGADPGIKTTRFIFNFTYVDGNKEFFKDKMMLVPDQVTFHMSESCAKSRTSNAYSGQTSYKNELSVNVEASGMYVHDDAVFMYDTSYGGIYMFLCVSIIVLYILVDVLILCS